MFTVWTGRIGQFDVLPIRLLSLLVAVAIARLLLDAVALLCCFTFCAIQMNCNPDDCWFA